MRKWPHEQEAVRVGMGARQLAGARITFWIATGPYGRATIVYSTVVISA